MAKDPINTDDAIFKIHAAYIFKALQHTRICVVVRSRPFIKNFHPLTSQQIDGAQLAAEDGFPKASSVQTQISRIAARWGLNIRATTGGGGGGGVGGAVIIKPPRITTPKARTSTPKRKKQLAIEWRGESSDMDSDIDAMEMPPRAKARKSPRTPKPKKRDRNFIYEDLDDNGEGQEEEDAELKPSPANKRFFHPVWTSEDEKDDIEEDGYVTAEIELLEATETIEVE